jgi:osmoprotectant transport system permease protein
VGEVGGGQGGGNVNLLWDGVLWIFEPDHWAGTDGVPSRVWEHLQVSLIGLALAALIAIPIGLWIGHTRRGEFLAVQVANVGRSVPSLAVLSIVFLLAVKVSPTVAFGFPPIVAALTLLGIPVILINTYVGVRQVDVDAIDAARGMGMNGRQILAGVEVPLATPLVFTGIRLAAVQIVATTGLWALAAGGALGRYIIDGYALQENDRIVAGVILIAGLTLAIDGLFALAGRAASPKTHS